MIKRNKFYFKDINLEPLLEENKKFFTPIFKDKLEIKNLIKAFFPEINYRISKK